MASNIPNGSINLHNYVTSSDTSITDVKSNDLTIYTVGIFKTNIVSLYNSDNINSTTTLYSDKQSNAFCCAYNLDQTLKWKISLRGDIRYVKLAIDETGLYIYGMSGPEWILMYDNNNDVIEAGTLVIEQPCFFIYKIGLDGISRGDNVGLKNYIKNCITLVPEYYDKIFCSPVSNSLYIALPFTNVNSVPISDRTGDVINTILPITAYGSAILKYTTDGVYETTAVIYVNELTTDPTNPSRVIPTSLNTLGQIFIAVDFNRTLYFPTILLCNGNKNICIAQYDTNLTLVGRLRIGGSATDTGCKLVTDTTDLYAIGSFTSIPVVFYKSDDSIDTDQVFLQNNVITDANNFMVKYPINFIANNLAKTYRFRLSTTTSLQPTDITFTNLTIIAQSSLL